MNLDWKRIIVTTAITVVVVLLWSVCVVPLITPRNHVQADGPERPMTYTTEDGKHHGCTLVRITDVFGSDKSWKLTCPDGFVQHNGNYYIEKN